MKKAYRDGLELFTKNEIFEGPNKEIIEILYTKDGFKKILC